jgi:hypothetical protein
VRKSVQLCRTVSGQEPALKLSQSRGVLRIDSEIRPDGVFYRERGLLSSNESKVPFEHIGDDLVRTFHVPRLYLFISLFFGLLLGLRVFRFMSTNTVSLGSLIWSTVLFAVPSLGTWMQSPKYVGYLTSRGGLLFFEKKGAEDPAQYLEEIQGARAAYFRSQGLREAGVHDPDDHDSDPSPIH